MRARLATMAKEREDFVAQRTQLEQETRNSSLGKIQPVSAVAVPTATEDATASSSKPPLHPLLALKRRTSGVGLSDSFDAKSPSSSQTQLSASSSNLGGAVTLTQQVIVPGGTRVSDWAFSSPQSTTESTAAAAPPVVRVNEVYETVRNLGRGAFGDVFLVRNLEDSRMFADKTIFCEKESLMADILRELVLLRKYRHPFIVDIHDGFVIANPRVMHIILSYCEAGDLGKVIHLHRKNKSSVAEAQVSKWMLQIALAMAFLHESGVIHRDLKPCNVMLTEGGELVKVCDLGLAVELASGGAGGGRGAGGGGGGGGRGGEEASAQSEAGTPFYTAPEMVQGKRYSFPADCWSFGVMIYELLSLNRPFDGSSTADLVKAILLEAPSPPLPSHYSESLRSLVLRFLVKEPTNRMGFAGFLTDSPLAARVSTLPQAYRPKSLEERIKRAHAKQLVSQIELLPVAKNSSLRGMRGMELSVGAAEAAAALPAIIITSAPATAAASAATSSPLSTSPMSTSPFVAQRKRLVAATAPGAVGSSGDGAGVCVGGSGGGDIQVQPTILEEVSSDVPNSGAGEGTTSGSSLFVPHPPSHPKGEPSRTISHGIAESVTAAIDVEALLATAAAVVLATESDAQPHSTSESVVNTVSEQTGGGGRLGKRLNEAISLDADQTLSGESSTI